MGNNLLLISNAVRRAALARSACRCAFPNCSHSVALYDGALVLEFAYIDGQTPGGPRFDPSCPANEVQSLDNVIVLCPTHHMLVDAQPEKYSAEFLRKIRAAHEEAVSTALTLPPVPVKPAGPQPHLTYSAALEFWRANRDLDEEERWQELLKANARILALALPDDLIMIGDKCYLGGKHWTNKGGQVADFLFASRQTLGVTIIEIKTPLTRLIGGRVQV